MAVGLGGTEKLLVTQSSLYMALIDHNCWINCRVNPHKQNINHRMDYLRRIFVHIHMWPMLPEVFMWVKLSQHKCQLYHSDIEQDGKLNQTHWHHSQFARQSSQLIHMGWLSVYSCIGFGVGFFFCNKFLVMISHIKTSHT